MPDHDDLAPKRSKANVAREARAAEAKVSPATWARVEQIAKRPDLEKKVVAGEMKPAEALREIRSTKRREQLEEAAAKAVEAQNDSDRPAWSILNVDVLDGLAAVRDEHGPAHRRADRRADGDRGQHRQAAAGGVGAGGAGQAGRRGADDERASSKHLGEGVIMEGLMASTAVELKGHPAADGWPMMKDKAFAQLRDDIEKKGQEEPITICDGMILDGRNRYRACIELGIKPITREYRGNPWDYAWTMNGPRRDLDETVKCVIFLRYQKESAKWEKKHGEIKDDANRKRSEAAKGNTNAAKEKLKTVVAHDEQPLSLPKKAVAREARAAEAQVSPSTMALAVRIAERLGERFQWPWRP